MNKKGFTLVEILTSTVIIAVLAGGMFGAFVGAQYIFNRARHRMQAVNFAREAQDRLRSNYQYDSAPAMTIGTSKPESNIGTIVRGDMTGLNTVLTYDVSEPEANGYKKVIVRVTWDETTL